MIWKLIFFSVLMTLDLWLNTILVHDIYLESMEVICSWLISKIWLCKILSFALIIFFEVATLAWTMDCFPLEDFNHIKILVYWSLICVWVVSFGVWPVSIYPIILTWYQGILEGCLYLLIQVQSWCDCMCKLFSGSTISNCFRSKRSSLLFLQCRV